MPIRFKDPISGIDVEVDTIKEFREFVTKPDIIHVAVDKNLTEGTNSRFSVGKEVEDFLRYIGVRTIHLADTPILEGNYLKFMSHNGLTDKIQCDEFEEWLRGRKATYERASERSIRNIQEDIAREINEVAGSIYSGND